MTDVYRNMIVTASDAETARQIAEDISPVAGANMWITPLSTNGQKPNTHYISTGFIGPEWEQLMPLQTYQRDTSGNWIMVSSYPGNAQALFQACQQYQIPVTLQQIEDLFNNSDVTTQEPQEALNRLGLKLVQSEDNIP